MKSGINFLRRHQLTGLAAAIVVCAFGITHATDETLSTFTTSDGKLNALVRTSNDIATGVSTFQLRVNGVAKLAIVQYRNSSRVVISPATGGASLDVSATTSGTTLNSISMTYGGSTTVWSTSDSQSQQDQSLNGFATLIGNVSAGQLMDGISRIHNLLDGVDPVATGTETLRLLDGIGNAHTTPGVQPLGAVGDYYNCLKDGCIHEAGGEWSEGTGLSGGCHCNPMTHGWGYCTQSAAVYFMVQMHCWAVFINPFK